MVSPRFCPSDRKMWPAKNPCHKYHIWGTLEPCTPNTSLALPPSSPSPVQGRADNRIRDCLTDFLVSWLGRLSMENGRKGSVVVMERALQRKPMLCLCPTRNTIRLLALLLSPFPATFIPFYIPHPKPQRKHTGVFVCVTWEDRARKSRGTGVVGGDWLKKLRNSSDKPSRLMS